MNATNSADLPISKELLEILRDPLAVQEKEKYGADPGKLELVHNCWLVSNDTGLKYPIRDGIPIMLIDEGMKWKNTPVSSLPVPPPSSGPAPTSSSTTYTAGGNDEGMSKPMMLALIGAVALFLILLLRKKED